MTFERKRSNWWYLLPIFLGLIGGIIAYFAIRKDDLPKAKKCIYLSLILLAVGIFLDLLFNVTEPDLWYGVNI